MGANFYVDSLCLDWDSPKLGSPVHVAHRAEWQLAVLALYLPDRVSWPVPHHISQTIVNNTTEAFDHECQRIVPRLISTSSLAQELSHACAVRSLSPKEPLHQAFHTIC